MRGPSQSLLRLFVRAPNIRWMLNKAQLKIELNICVHYIKVWLYHDFSEHCFHSFHCLTTEHRISMKPPLGLCLHA